MENTFCILGKELTFSDEKVNYVKLKREYDRKISGAREMLQEKLPEATEGDIGALIGNALITTYKSNKDDGTLGKLKEYGAIFNEVKNEFLDYGLFKHFIDIRNSYITEYLKVITTEAESILSELQEQGVDTENYDTETMVKIALSMSCTGEYLEEAAQKISNSKGVMFNVSDAVLPFVQTMENFAVQERDNLIHSEEDAIVYNCLVGPLNKCFFTYAYSSMFSSLVQVDEDGDIKNVSSLSNAAEKISNRVFSNIHVQNALKRGAGIDVFQMFQQKMSLFQENNLCTYESISDEDAERAEQLYQEAKAEDCEPDTRMENLTEALALDPYPSDFYTAILDFFSDENGELQKLAKIMDIDVTSHIESILMKIYKDGDIGTLESTLELKEQIFAKEKSFHYSDSKAAKSILFRQHFLELGRIADEMSLEEITENWKSIQNGNNTFATGEQSDVDDENCILILRRRFLRLHVAEYHDVIRNLHLKDDATDGDKNYAFYEEGEDYIDFEEECKKINGGKLERDADFTVQNYAEDKLASGEVILGYFHYARVLDIVGDGKTLFITNKRIYTTKEKFTEFNAISQCEPVKKLMLTYIVFHKTDGTVIQLPVSKELMIPAADMINRLIAALKGTEYVADSVTVSNSQNIEAAKTMIFDTANSMKKGLGALFGKKPKK
ncbi:hypothetical protein [Ruminococcus callidus]|jgi:hypothetical protein|uniref:hypothetical protein n=3 Tax=Ruminococcus callidus TaxID=40519 RepID=UPI000ED346F3|nr:hypothetical protein [Ruminococcus callidus]HCD40181.1 hypothetical protein [Ruminococcus sp.]HCY35215.1 hypothetical protein [Ruminococcus sp.]